MLYFEISGAQWNKENVVQVLKHQCAYLKDHLEVIFSTLVLHN